MLKINNTLTTNQKASESRSRDNSEGEGCDLREHLPKSGSQDFDFLQ